MKSANNNSSDHDESKNHNIKCGGLSKFEYDLYHEEDDVVEKIIRVKRVSFSSNNEKWKILENNKIIFTIEGAKLSNKEKEYLRTVDGFNFLITQYKNGLKSINYLKKEIKNHLK